MKGFCSEIVKGFGYKLKSYTPFRNILICNTNHGIKVIKPVENSISKLLFQYSVKEHLYNKGFKQIDRFYISSKNMPYYIHEGTPYVMTDWVEGKECDFSNLYDIKKAISTLGDMHKVSKGMTPVEGSLIKPYEENLPFKMKKRIVEFRRIKKIINRQSHLSDFDLLFLRHYRDYEEHGLRALGWLKEIDYNAIRNKIQKEKFFCHNDYTYHNLLMLPKGHVYVTRFEHCKYGFPIYDLIYVLKKIMRKHKWDIKVADELLLLYNQKVDINDVKNVLISLLLFPDDFWKVCNRYYNSKRSWAFQSPVNKLGLIINQKENLNQFIKYVETL